MQRICALVDSLQGHITRVVPHHPMPGSCPPANDPAEVRENVSPWWVELFSQSSGLRGGGRNNLMSSLYNPMA